MADVRATIVFLAGAAVSIRDQYHYTQGPLRMSAVHNPSMRPIWCDCSAFVTYLYSWAGAPDPNGLGYNGTGYTGTLISGGQQLGGAAQAIPGDLVIYGAGTGDHVAIITEAGADPLTVSMGQEGDPNFVRVSQDGRPARFFRYSTETNNPNPPPTPPGHRTLKLGDRGLDVGAVQSKLKISADCIYGDQTRAAVAAFQQWVHLVSDGIVGPQTWAAFGI